MRYINCITLVLLNFCVQGIEAQTLYHGEGHIPLSHKEPWTHAGMLTDASSITPKAVFVVPEMPGDGLDAKVDTAIARANNHVSTTHGLAIIFFPQGDYYLNNPISLTQADSNIVFQGEGSDKTTLVFQGIANSNCFSFGGTAEAWVDLTQDIDKGDNIIHTNSNGLINISEGKALAGQEVAAILHEKPSADTTGKQLFGKAYQAWIEGDTDAAGMQFAQLAQECPSSPAGLQALSMAVRCYDRNKDSDGAGSYLEKIIKEKSTSVISELAMSIKVGRLARLGKYDEAAGAAQQLLNSATDGTLRKYALYDLATLLYHFLNDKQNGEKYYRQLLAEYPEDPLSEIAASALGQTVDEQVNEKLAKASTLPTEYGLSQNYPNPFNPETRIQFTLPEAAQVRIEVMNVLGQRIAVLCDGSMAAGYHAVRWDGRTASGEKAASGMYFCRMRAGNFIRTIKMMLLP